MYDKLTIRKNELFCLFEWVPLVKSPYESDKDNHGLNDNTSYGENNKEDEKTWTVVCSYTYLGIYDIVELERDLIDVCSPYFV